MRILVAEDDACLAETLCAVLRNQSHAVDVVGDGAQACAALATIPYDLMVLDLGLPSMDGGTVLHCVRERGDELPVLVVSAREEVDERIRILDLGADDYLAKPFELGEFHARVRAQLRRAASGGRPVLRIGRLQLDVPGRRAWVGGTPIALTAREFGLLGALALRPGMVAARATLIETLCTFDQTLSDNGLDIAIHRLRRKLRGSGASVTTVRGLGYALGAETPPR
jgi:two-component system OmpR family response regulator